MGSRGRSPWANTATCAASCGVSPVFACLHPRARGRRSKGRQSAGLGVTAGPSFCARPGFGGDPVQWLPTRRTGCARPQSRWSALPAASRSPGAACRATPGGAWACCWPWPWWQRASSPSRSWPRCWYDRARCRRVFALVADEVGEVVDGDAECVAHLLDFHREPATLHQLRLRAARLPDVRGDLGDGQHLLGAKGLFQVGEGVSVGHGLLFEVVPPPGIEPGSRA